MTEQQPEIGSESINRDRPTDTSHKTSEEITSSNEEDVKKTQPIPRGAAGNGPSDPRPRIKRGETKHVIRKDIDLRLFTPANNPARDNIDSRRLKEEFTQERIKWTNNSSQMEEALVKHLIESGQINPKNTNTENPHR